MNQTEGIDATSKFQDSLPVSSDMLLQQLTDWQTEYQRFDHVLSGLLRSQKKSNLCFGRRHKAVATLKTYTCAIIKNAILCWVLSKIDKLISNPCQDSWELAACRSDQGIAYWRIWVYNRGR
jgi:hypothetical protein